MAENRRSINLVSLGDTGSTRDFDQTIKSMEEQLRIQAEIASAERDRQMALEKTREQQQQVSREAEKSLQSTHKALSEMNSSTQKFVSSAGSSFKSLFSGIFKGEIVSAGDAWSAFCNFLINAWSKAISRMLSHGLEDLMGNLFGGFGGFGGGGTGGNSGAGEGSILWSETPDWFLNFHSGGIVGLDGTHRMASSLLLAGAPRLHSGLASDEFPAILQKGEIVIPKGGWSRGEMKSGQSTQALNVEVKIDNQSSAPLKLEQGVITHSLDKMIIGIVAKDINEYGVLGQMLRNRKA